MSVINRQTAKDRRIKRILDVCLAIALFQISVYIFVRIIKMIRDARYNDDDFEEEYYDTDTEMDMEFDAAEALDDAKESQKRIIMEKIAQQKRKGASSVKISDYEPKLYRETLEYLTERGYDVYVDTSAMDEKHKMIHIYYGDDCKGEILDDEKGSEHHEELG